MDRLRLIAFSRPAGLVAALRNGAFAAEDLEIEFSRATGSGPQIRALLAGEHDIAHTAADNVVAHVDHAAADLVVLLVAELGIGQRLVVRPEVASVADLAGRTVGVDAVGSGYALVLYRLLADAGLRRGAYAVESLGGTAERYAALGAGRIAGALLSPPHDERAAAFGARVLAAASSAFPGYPALTVAARRSWARSNADLARRYCRALLAGVRWAADPRNRDACIDLVGADLGAERATAEAAYERERVDRERAAPTVAQMREALSLVAELRRELTGAPATTDLDRYFDPAYVRAADPALAG